MAGAAVSRDQSHLLSQPVDARWTSRSTNLDVSDVYGDITGDDKGQSAACAKTGCPSKRGKTTRRRVLWQSVRSPPSSRPTVRLGIGGWAGSPAARSLLMYLGTATTGQEAAASCLANLVSMMGMWAERCDPCDAGSSPRWMHLSSRQPTWLWLSHRANVASLLVSASQSDRHGANDRACDQVVDMDS